MLGLFGGITLFLPIVAGFCDHRTVVRRSSSGSHLERRAVLSNFGYDGPKGPLYWHTLSPENYACANGTSQSPIDIHSRPLKKIDGATLGFFIENTASGRELENLGLTLEVYGLYGTLGKAVSGRNNLVQFHMHTTAEHKTNGLTYPMEVHFVFQDRTTRALSVVGFFVDTNASKSKSSPFLEAAYANTNAIKKQHARANTPPLKGSELVNHINNSKVYVYSGSLTTPPCTENVSWYVVETPLQVSVDTWKRIRDITKFNSRFVQSTPGSANILAPVL